MTYHFKNLVFEGGGVKGIAYVGAMSVLEEKGVLSNIKRVGGASAGAITATLFALGYSVNEMNIIMKELDFNKFTDGSMLNVLDYLRIFRRFGKYKGNFFHSWLKGLIANKLGSGEATFKDLANENRPELYVVSANLSTESIAVWSQEDSPDEPIANAVRKSMSIPLFFAAKRDKNKHLHADGGLIDNYPFRLFDLLRYVAPQDREKMAIKTTYYEILNKTVSPNEQYIFNRQTLGFCLKSKKTPVAYRVKPDAARKKHRNLLSFLKATATIYFENIQEPHLHSDDWNRTVMIDSLGVGTTEFDLTDEKKERLRRSGIQATRSYFQWLDHCMSEGRLY